LNSKTFGTIAIAGLTSLAMLTTSVTAETVKPEAVKITDDGTIPKSLTGKPGDPVAGKKAFVGRKLGNCLACHVNKDASEQQFHGEVGPALDGVADRHEPGALRAIIVNSKAVFGYQTLMPGFYRNVGLNRVNKKFKGKTILSPQQVEDVLAYLLTLKE